jgi:hypothetical protein
MKIVEQRVLHAGVDQIGLVSAACVGWACSEPEADEPMRCDLSCPNATTALFVGRYDEAQLGELTGEQPMDYGPQGGQHFYVDAELGIAVAGRVRLRVEFIDSDGRVVGVGRAQVEADHCGARFTDVPVVVEEDKRQSGTLRATAEVLTCSWSIELRKVNIVPPLPESEDAGVYESQRDGG